MKYTGHVRVRMTLTDPTIYNPMTDEFKSESRIVGVAASAELTDAVAFLNNMLRRIQNMLGFVVHGELNILVDEDEGITRQRVWNFTLSMPLCKGPLAQAPWFSVNSFNEDHSSASLCVVLADLAREIDVVIPKNEQAIAAMPAMLRRFGVDFSTPSRYGHEPRQSIAAAMAKHCVECRKALDFQYYEALLRSKDEKFAALSVPRVEAPTAPTPEPPQVPNTGVPAPPSKAVRRREDEAGHRLFAAAVAAAVGGGGGGDGVKPRRVAVRVKRRNDRSKSPVAAAAGAGAAGHTALPPPLPPAQAATADAKRSESPARLGIAQIFVRPLFGPVMTLDIEGCDTVQTILNMIEQKSGRSPSQHYLIYCGRHLDPEHTLDFYQIKRESVLQLGSRISGS
jgi:hypothetical protein